MSENQVQKRGRGRPPSTAFVDTPQGLRERLRAKGFYEPRNVFAPPHGWPPDCSEFSPLDRFRITFVRYAQLFGGDFEKASNALSISWRHFKRYLKGEIEPGRKRVNQLATAAGVAPEWIETGLSRDTSRPKNASEFVREDSRPKREQVPQEKDEIQSLRSTWALDHDFGETLPKYEIADRVREAIRSAGGSAALGTRWGIPASALSEPEAASGLTDLEGLYRVAQATGRSLDWLVTGRDGQSFALEAKAYQGFVPVPRLQVKASAGAGALAVLEDLEEEGVVMFREAWMRRIGVNPRTAQALTAVGDSMEPTIRDGDLLLVDRSIDRIVDNGIYVVVLGGMVLVKRVQVKRDGSIVLRSDNTDLYEAEHVPADEVHTLTVEGRVRWFGRTI